MISFRDVRKVYRQGERDVAALDGIDLLIEGGEFVAVMGPSGSGKSTLLHLAAGLDLPSSGELFIDGEATHAMNDDQLTALRRRKIGLVFQFFNLIPTLTVLENVALPLLITGKSIGAVRDKAKALLDRVGVGDRATHVPEELSGGEIQRTAIARALITDPEVLLADEPTGNLDSKNGADILALLKEVSKERTIVMVTHDPSAAAIADRTIRLKDGRLE